MEFKYDLILGKGKFVSYILFDIFCLLAANFLVVWLFRNVFYAGSDHDFHVYHTVLYVMVGIDLIVTVFLSTLCRVFKRSFKTEVRQGVRHVGASFVLLTMVLFLLRQGRLYSRMIVSVTYGVYFLLFIGGHYLWKLFLPAKIWKAYNYDTALLMTTDGFAEEGLRELRKIKIDVKYVYLLKNLDIKEINDTPVLKTWEAAAAAVCWKNIERVYIYGLDHTLVPQYLMDACNDMKLKVDLIDFNYKIIEVTTMNHSDPKYGSLSFLENKRDIPFSIRRVYWITETETEIRRGFHSHKRNCQLLWCPMGEIDILLDDGEKKSTVKLDRPGKGLILMPGMWREMVWRKSGSVLCVLASEFYDPDEYIRDYDKFLEYNRMYRENASPLKKYRRF